MTPLEIRKLIGGYATGSLSDAERKLLFEAALEDQELFDELAGEQALKELLDEPGARGRLIAALRPPQAARPWWLRAWPWAAAAAAIAAGVAISLIPYRPATPKQVARVFTPPPVIAPVPSPLPEPPQLRIQSVVPPEIARTAPNFAPAPKPQPAPAAEPERAPQPPQFAAPTIAGFRALPQSAVRSLAAPLGPPFDYILSDDGKLRITPSVRGFITVITNTPQTLALNQAAEPGVAAEFTVPAGANMLTVFLTPQPSPSTAPPAEATVVRIQVKPREEK
ncbi:MAG TPA: hypothetical protein VH639_28270 [Bryobacteraceae bacterium]|jgi:hypothetical protein